MRTEKEVKTTVRTIVVNFVNFDNFERSDNFRNLNKIRTYGGYFESFMDTLSEKEHFIFDEGNIVVLFNGFQKKSQKTPQGEIEKAIKIKEAYYADKQSQNR